MPKAKVQHKGNNSLGFTTLTYWRRIILMFCIFVMMMFLAGFGSMLAARIAPDSERDRLIWTSVFQNLIGFGGTAIVTALFLSVRPFSLLGLTTVGNWRALVGILLVFALGIPFLNQVIYWNEHMHLPSFLASLETTIRAWEENALSQTSVLLEGKSVGTLVVNVLVVGVLTGFCEELVFRGTFQRVIGSGGMSPHLAIWITAAIFSILHFQFFGFLPRLLLGAFFGYLFYWTGSIWIAGAAHALNNTITVVLTWLVANGFAPVSVDGFGVTAHGFPVMAAISLVLTLFVLIGMRSYLFSTHKI